MNDRRRNGEFRGSKRPSRKARKRNRRKGDAHHTPKSITHERPRELDEGLENLVNLIAPSMREFVVDFTRRSPEFLPKKPPFSEEDRRRIAELKRERKILLARKRDLVARIKRNNRYLKDRWVDKRSLWNRLSIGLTAFGVVGIACIGAGAGATVVAQSLGLDSVLAGFYLSTPGILSPFIAKAFFQGPLERHQKTAENIFYSIAALGIVTLTLQFALHFPMDLGGSGMPDLGDWESTPAGGWGDTPDAGSEGGMKPHFPSLWGAVVALECAGSYFFAKKFCEAVAPQRDPREDRIEKENDGHKEGIEGIGLWLAAIEGELAVLESRRDSSGSLNELLEKLSRWLSGRK